MRLGFMLFFVLLTNAFVISLGNLRSVVHKPRPISIFKTDIDAGNRVRSKTEWDFNISCRISEISPINNYYEAGSATCFGTKIDYNYTINENITFPTHLEAIEKFPSCWNLLKPLICAVNFRPVSIREAWFRNERMSVSIKLTQVFPQSMCLDAKRKCQFLVDKGLWPSELNCENKIEIRPVSLPSELGLFSNQCSLPYSHFSKSLHSKCLYPLVDLKENAPKNSKAHIIDTCYLPKTSIFVSEKENLIVFRRAIFLWSTLMAICFLSGMTYTALNCYQFPLIALFMSIGLFHTVWAISSVMSLQNETTSLIRAENPMHASFNLCWMQSVSMNFLLLNAFGWLTALSYVESKKPTKNLISHKKFCLRWIFYISTFVFTEALFFGVSIWNQVDLADGLTGTCFSLIGPLKSNSLLYITILSSLILGIFINGRKNVETFGSREFLVTPNKQSRFLPIKLNFFMVVFGLVAFSITVVLHLLFQFTSVDERLSLQGQINCIFETLRNGTQNMDLNGIPDMTMINFIQFLVYAFCLPSFFLTILFGAMCLNFGKRTTHRVVPNILPRLLPFKENEKEPLVLNGEEINQDYTTNWIYKYLQNERQQQTDSAYIEASYSGDATAQIPNQVPNERISSETTTNDNSSTNGSTSISSSQTEYYIQKFIIIKAIYRYALQMGFDGSQKHQFADRAVRFLEQAAALHPLFLNYGIWDFSSMMEHSNYLIMNGHIIEMSQLFTNAVGCAYIELAVNSNNRFI